MEMSNSIDAMLLNRRLVRIEHSLVRIQTLMECTHSQLHQFNNPGFNPFYNDTNSDTESNYAEDEPVSPPPNQVGQAG